jgi:hypothetical protein
MEHARQLERDTGVHGLVTADRLFSLLERDFDTSAIDASVAQALKPKDGVDLSAHKIVLEIARGIDGRVRLVTTNFDLLFEACDASLVRTAAPRLPDPARFDDLAGVIHLHGHVVDDYSRAADDGFVLSSAGFGRAYLSEAWATNFIRSLLGKYCVLFLGYGADDPPVQYLLEALNRSAGSSGEVYAFQSGTENEAAAIWRHRGVKSIPYDEAKSHEALWTTLEAWAIRSKDPKAWIDNVIDAARTGPQALPPHLRGQVAHIISTRDGARQFAVASPPPPAIWLCVFDHSVRYLKPGRTGRFGEQGVHFDPFDSFGLDSDPVPEKIKPDVHYAKWEIPTGLWDGLAPNRLDIKNAGEDGYAQLRGHWASNVSHLPARLGFLSAWIIKVADQPAAIWWASGQTGLHPDFQRQLQLELYRNTNSEAGDVRRAWRYIFEAWETQLNERGLDGLLLRDTTILDGWNSATIREYARLHSPHLTVTRPWMGPRPPDGGTIRWKDLMHVAIKYPNPHVEILIPDEYLTRIVKELRVGLEIAVNLENELGSYRLDGLPPLERDPELDEGSVNLFGLSRAVFFFVSLLRRLMARFPIESRRELLAWAANDDAIFARLRIWVTGHPGILPPAEAAAVFTELNQNIFWGMRHQRDLLVALNRRWAELPTRSRSSIKARIWRGPSRWQSESKADYARRRAYAVLDRIYWLNQHGHDLGPNFDARANILKALVPQWTENNAARAAISTEARSGWVKRDTTYAALLRTPVSNIVAEAARLSERSNIAFVENDPFAGLVAEQPLIAVSALGREAKKKVYPGWAWEKLLSSESRGKDKPRLILLIAERLVRVPTDVSAVLAYSISSWFLTTSEILVTRHPHSFMRLWNYILEILRSTRDAAGSQVVRTATPPDWATEAINGPVGKLAEILMNDPELKSLGQNAGLPKGWIDRADTLLSLPGDARRHAIVIFVYSLARLYYLDPQWTERQLLAILDSEGADYDAFWEGFFWSAQLPQENLYLRLKLHLLRLARYDTRVRRNHANVLASVILAGWGSIGFDVHLVTDVEMHEILVNSDDHLRSSILWYLERWTEEHSGWRAKKLDFLKVWPREKAARTSSVTARLVDLAFDDPENFPAVVDTILPLVTQLSDRTPVFLGQRQPERTIDVLTKNPEKVLALLWNILPETIANWPYNAPETLEQIVKADGQLKLDRRYIELERRWNSR